MRAGSLENVMNLIAHFRELAGIKQRDLVRALGWTQARISNYEACRRTPGLAESREIVSSLNELGASCTLDEVFPRKSTPQKAA